MTTYKSNTAISIYNLLKKFPDEESARKYLEQQKWNGKPKCHHCNSEDVVIWRKDRSGYYRCHKCRTVFCVKTNTIFAHTLIPLDKWLLAFYMVVTARKGISSMQLSKELGITQKSAWLLLSKIRYAMGNNDYNYLLKGIVEVDETYVNGKESNKHLNKRVKIGRGVAGKTPIFGIVERNGKLYTKVVPNTKRTTLQSIITQKVKQNSVVNTDGALQYIGIENFGYDRKSVNHSAKQYVNGMDYTNTIESVWAVLKRGFYGTYHKFSLKHLQKYVDEFQFRWNEGNCRYNTMDRIDSLINRCWGKMLPYKVLIGKIS